MHRDALTGACAFSPLPAFLLPPKRHRWTLCATDRCFKYQALVPFFTAAKVCVRRVRH